MRDRNKCITVRLNEEEHARVTRLCERTGLKKEPLIRKLLAGESLAPKPNEEYREVVRQLTGISNSVNQILSKADRTDPAQRELAEGCQSMMSEIWKLVQTSGEAAGGSNQNHCDS